MLGNLTPVPASHLPIAQFTHNNPIRVWIDCIQIESTFWLSFLPTNFMI